MANLHDNLKTNMAAIVNKGYCLPYNNKNENLKVSCYHFSFLTEIIGGKISMKTGVIA